MTSTYTIVAVLMGFFLDLCFGDPRWLYHPVRIMGFGIGVFEKVYRKILPKNKWGERMGGVLLVLSMVLLSISIPFFILKFAYSKNVWVGFLLESFFCYQLLATKSLKDESMKVYKALKTGDIEQSRFAVSMIVGRDTAALDEVGVTKAAVETIAENTSDGIVAVLFYMMFGGAVGGFFYKAINTMDSMVGYKNERYRYFGTIPAKLDDLVNYIPARLAGVIMILGAFFCKFDGVSAEKIFLRDRYNHASPNSAQTEAAMAGALGIQLAGDAYYFGKLYKKKYIGDPTRRIEIFDIKRANRLLYVTAFISLIIFLGFRLGIQYLLF